MKSDTEYSSRDIFTGNELLRQFVCAVENLSMVHAGREVFWAGRLTACSGV